MVLFYLSWGGKKLSSHLFLKPKLLVKRIKRATHTYLSAFSKSNIAKANVNLIKNKYKIRGPFIWNTFLGASEKNIEFFSHFKSKVKAKLLFRNDIIWVGTYISRIKGNRTIKFGQLFEYNKKK